MQAGNGTGDPADYGQGGGGGGVRDPFDTLKKLDDVQAGKVGAHSATPPFVPDGNEPWWVRFRNERTGKECTQDGITDPDAIVVVVDWDACNIVVLGSREG